MCYKGKCVLDRFTDKTNLIPASSYLNCPCNWSVYKWCIMMCKWYIKSVNFLLCYLFQQVPWKNRQNNILLIVNGSEVGVYYVQLSVQLFRYSTETWKTLPKNSCKYAQWYCCEYYISFIHMYSVYDYDADMYHS